MSSIASASCSSRAITSIACRCSIWPLAVARTPRCPRSSNAMPQCCSSSAMRLLAAASEMPKRSAPAVRLPASSTATNRRSETRSRRLSLRFAQELAKRSNGALKVNVYPGSSLMKVNAQLSAARKGALDLTLIPLPYGGGEIPELNIALMPGLVTSYEQGFAWKKAEIGKALTDLLADKGVIIVTWIWQAGGAASRTAPIIAPEDVKGLKFRGGSREMDLVAKAAGAATLSLPSSETYAAMQTGAV